jgi:hypothetical protein
LDRAVNGIECDEPALVGGAEIAEIVGWLDDCDEAETN